MRYRPEIDGLRAVAVGAVLLYHAGVPGIGGGFAGVDVFFVISGYLITSIILGELAEDRFSLRRFFERRVRRIAPAFLLVTGATLVAAWFAFHPSSFLTTWWSAIAAMLFLSNVFFYHTVDYFAASSLDLPLIHTWSLAIEEQFYILLPIVMLGIWRIGGTRRLALLAAVLAALALASFGLALREARVAPEAAFYLLHTRAWELLAGSLLALALRTRGPGTGRLAGASGLLGLGLVCISFAVIGGDTPWPGTWTLLPVLGTVLVLGCAGPGTAAARLLALPPLVGLGLVSYSLYLWHVPFLVFGQAAGVAPDDLPARLALVAASGLAAWASWRFVERPFRDAARVGRRQVAALFGSTVALPIVLVAASATVPALHQAQFLNGLDAEGRAVQQAIARIPPQEPLGAEGCKFTARMPDDAWRARFEACRTRHGPAIVVIGDSHAIDLFNALALATGDVFLAGLTQERCRPHTRRQLCHYSPFAGFLEEHPGAVARIVFTQSGTRLRRASPAGRVSLDEPNVAAVEAQLAAFAHHAPVLWLGPRPEPGLRLTALPGIPRAAWTPDAARLAAVEALDRLLAERAAASGAPATYVSQTEALGFDFARDFMVDGEFTYADADHWTPAGERLFGARLAPRLLPGVPDGIGRLGGG